MKVKTTTFNAENLRTARIILQDEAKYGTLVVQWARLVAGKAPADSALEREAQGGLFEPGAAA